MWDKIGNALLLRENTDIQHITYVYYFFMFLQTDTCYTNNGLNLDRDTGDKAPTQKTSCPDCVSPAGDSHLR